MAHSLAGGAVSNALSAGNDIFFVLAHGSPQPMLITNDRVEIQYVNPAWERQFGYTIDEVKGQNPRILKSGKTPPDVYRNMWETLKSGKAFQTTDVIDKRKDGSFFNLRSTVFPVAIGDTLHYVQILDDITDEKRAKEFQKLYLRAAAHDMRTPLQSLRIISDMELLDHDTEHIRDMQAHIKRVDEMMSTLLDSRQFEAGEISLRTRAFDISELLHDMARGQHAHAGVVEHMYTDPMTVSADPDRIAQVITNLIENALKYGGSSKPVAVRVIKKEGKAVVSVSDSGRGIPHDEQPHIFEPNFRTMHARTSSVSGSGLGLYIVQQIIRKHGERVWVESEPGSGATFYFTLPLSQ